MLGCGVDGMIGGWPMVGPKDGGIVGTNSEGEGVLAGPTPTHAATTPPQRSIANRARDGDGTNASLM